MSRNLAKRMQKGKQIDSLGHELQVTSSPNHCIDLDSHMHEWNRLTKSPDQEYTSLNKVELVQELTNATPTDIFYDSLQNEEGSVTHPPNKCIKQRESMLLVSLLVVLALAGSVTTYLFVNRPKYNDGEPLPTITLNTIRDNDTSTVRVSVKISSSSEYNVHVTTPTGKPYLAPRDCMDVLSVQETRKSGIYTVYPLNSTQLEVYCDMETDGGGWTVFQKRFDGSVDFNRNFTQYETGFGSMTGEFWLGLQKMYAMTKGKVNVLRFDVQGNAGNFYESYQNFWLSPSPGYNLHIGNIRNTAETSVDDVTDWFLNETELVSIRHAACSNEWTWEHQYVVDLAKFWSLR